MLNGTRLASARSAAEGVSKTKQYQAFVESVRARTPWRFEKIPPSTLERDYLRIVDHHLQHLLPRVGPYLGSDIRNVLDFGCGSGGSVIALAMTYPELRCHGTDVDADEIAVARQRAQLYGVGERCDFHHVNKGQPLPFAANTFDLCQCSSVLEYVINKDIRRFCIQEMTRLLRVDGLLFVSVPNRLYPFEIHTMRWGWNYFPKLLHASIVDSTLWEIQQLAKPTALRLHRTPWFQLLKPWSNICLRKLR